MMRALMIAPAVAALCAAVVMPVGAQRVETAYARVTYISGSSVYISAGERDGVTEGALLDVPRGGRVIAQLRVRFVSPSRAQCDAVSGLESLAVGDSVRYTRQPTTIAQRDTQPAVQPTRSRRTQSTASRAHSLRGRIGVRYLATWERDSGQAQLAQPAFDVRLDGTMPGVQSIEVAVDARARRTRSVSIDGIIAPSRTSMLVYQTWVGFNAPNGARLRFGRQYSTDLAPVSLFDGALLGVERKRFGVGAFAGTQPDAGDMGHSTREREWGAYVAVRGTPRERTNLAVTLGGVSSYDGPAVDREFAFLSASWYGPKISLYASQEVDYNRGWKLETGESTLSPTSSFVSLNVRATEQISLRGGYDTRRNVRLYRNYVSPDIAFDDTFRTGVWAGAQAYLKGGVTAGIDVRRSTGGAVDTAATGETRRNGSDVYTVTAGVPSVRGIPVGVRARASAFRTAAASGSLQTLALSGSPLLNLHVQLTGGMRRDTPAPGTAAAAIADRLTVTWIELDTDVSLGRAWYLLLSASREQGGWESSDQIYTALTYRF
ncbi:MAG TPA: hypothetical protein VFU01_02825 [Gemmatimonadaceae bacterium]|nr:hypothetical protein [Gemmatimonadaceae bacterium]